MRTYLITYDLLTPGKDYTTLTGSLVRMGAVRILLSVWVLRSTSSHVEIRDALKALIDQNDRLLVARLTWQTAWSNILISNEQMKQFVDDQ